MTDLSKQHKVGDAYARVLTIPAVYPDGHFVGWTPASQIRRQDGSLLADCACTWIDAATTRQLYISVADTRSWPAGEVVQTDVQFTRDADDWRVSTTTANIRLVRDVTRSEVQS